MDPLTYTETIETDIFGNKEGASGADEGGGTATPTDGGDGTATSTPTPTPTPVLTDDGGLLDVKWPGDVTAPVR